MEPLYTIVTHSGYHEGRNVDRPYQLSFGEQVLACTESATLEYVLVRYMASWESQVGLWRTF